MSNIPGRMQYAPTTDSQRIYEYTTFRKICPNYTNTLSLPLKTMKNISVYDKREKRGHCQCLGDS